MRTCHILCLTVWIFISFIFCDSFHVCNKFYKAFSINLIRLSANNEQTPSRGTTVPTELASDISSLKRSHPKTFRSIETIDPTDPFTFGFQKLGKVLGAHGIRGELKVILEPGSEVKRFSKGAIVYVKKPNRRSPRAVRVNQCRRQGSSDDLQNIHLMTLDGVFSRTMALAFRQYDLYSKIGDVVSQKDEYMVRELVGLDCYLFSDYDAVVGTIAACTSSHSNKEQPVPVPPIGRVVGVVPAEELCDNPAAAKLMHSQLEVRVVSNMKGNGGKRRLAQNCLVPLVAAIVPVVDVRMGRIFLQPPLGLLDHTYDARDKPAPIRGYLPAAVGLSAQDRAYLAQRVTLSAARLTEWDGLADL